MKKYEEFVKINELLAASPVDVKSVSSENKDKEIKEIIENKEKIENQNRQRLKRLEILSSEYNLESKCITLKKFIIVYYKLSYLFNNNLGFIEIKKKLIEPRKNTLRGNFFN